MYFSAESEVSTTALCWTAKFLLPSFSRHLLCLVLCNAKGSCALVGYCAAKEVMLEDWSSRCVVLVAAAAVVIWWWWFFKGQVYDECIIEYTQCHPLSCHYCCLWKCALPVSQPASQSVRSVFVCLFFLSQYSWWLWLISVLCSYAVLWSRVHKSLLSSLLSSGSSI